MYSFILRITFYISEKGVDITIVVYIFDVIVAGRVSPETKSDFIFPPYLKFIFILFQPDGRNLILIKLLLFPHASEFIATFWNTCVVSITAWKWGKQRFFLAPSFPARYIHSSLWASVLGPCGSMLRFLCSFAPGPPSLLLLSAKFKLCWGVEISRMFSKVLFSTHTEQLLSPSGLEDCLELFFF